jgi:2-polyprenyl-3-methyl-5-hydroxy-6-metoxy-1,4-benzoquinol methylase
MERRNTLEQQNQIEYDDYLEKGPVKLGPWTSWMWRSDPKHLSFMLARYKFCSKLLEGKKTALEVGCGDGFALPIILQSVDFVHCVDFEPILIDEIKQVVDRHILERCTFSVVDFTEKTIDSKVDAVYSLDVIEHIPPQKEDAFMTNICEALVDNGVCIIGTPNIEASRFANPQSMEGHVNLKSAASLRSVMARYFENVFIFSMNDEVVHTGYHGMAHYLMALGAGKKHRR